MLLRLAGILSREEFLQTDDLGAAAGGTPAVAAATGPTISLNLADIQGNALAGFNKDHQAFLGIVFPKVAPGRKWLASIRTQGATAAEVSAFNAAFKADRKSVV